MSSRGRLYFVSVSLNVQNVPYKTQLVDQTSVNAETSYKKSPRTAVDTSQCLLSHLSQVYWLVSVLLAISYVVILYSATQFFHEKRFVCGAIYFVWVKHGFTTVDIFIVKAVTCVVLRTHIHCKKILCICQSQFLVCSVSKMKQGLLFFEETAGGQDIFSICCRHYSLFVTFLCP